VVITVLRATFFGVGGLRYCSGEQAERASVTERQGGTEQGRRSAPYYRTTHFMRGGAVPYLIALFSQPRNSSCGYSNSARICCSHGISSYTCCGKSSVSPFLWLLRGRHRRTYSPFFIIYIATVGAYQTVYIVSRFVYRTTRPSFIFLADLFFLDWNNHG